MIQRKKIKPGELLSSEKFSGPSNETDKQPYSSKSRGNEHSQVSNEDVQRCNYCKARWLGEDDDGNRWIVCDICSKKYHLQFSGIDYASDQYYDIDIENQMFFVKNVNKSLADVYVSCEVIKIFANFVLKYMQRKHSYNFIASLISLVKRFKKNV